MKKIKVLIIDDSALVRQVLTEMISKRSEFEVIGAPSDPIFAENYMKKEWPDVIIMDINMPKKDGLTFLKEIMQTRPTPVVICSSEIEANARASVEALALGAVSVISKPKIGIKDFLMESEKILVEAVRSAAATNIKAVKEVKTHSVIIEKKNSADVIMAPPAGKMNTVISDKIVVIGASAGGTQALEYLLKELPVNAPPIAIVQHMPEKFTEAFAKRLNDISTINVLEAKGGEIMTEGYAYIAMGNRHLAVSYENKSYKLSVIDGPLVSRHKPSVDVLFRSAAKSGSKNILGVILTGMGDDGAAGMLEMKNSGCITIAQDKETSAVYGMPKEAFDRGGVSQVLPLYEVPKAIMNFYR